MGFWHRSEDLFAKFVEANTEAIAGEVARDDIFDWLGRNEGKVPDRKVLQRDLLAAAFAHGLDMLDRQKVADERRIDFGWPGYDFSPFRLGCAEPDWFGESGHVTIPPEYFRETARRPYANIGWERALAREFEQNSRDAGARRIVFDLNVEARTLTVTDDGCGMDYATLTTGLLRLGGSVKPPGAVGGFGKAKELLFFGWETFEIATKRAGEIPLHVTGSGCQYEVMPGDPAHWPNGETGTQCTIRFQGDVDLNRLGRKMRHQLALSEGRASVFWAANPGDGLLHVSETGEIAQLKKGDLVRSLEWADVYVQKDVETEYVRVRLRGVHMFDSWIGSRGVQVIVEVRGESVDVLDESRTGLTFAHARELEKLVAEFTTDTQSAVKPQPVLKTEIVRQDGVVLVSHPVDLSVAQRDIVDNVSGRMATGTAFKEMMNKVWSKRMKGAEEIATSSTALSVLKDDPLFFSMLEQALEVVHYGVVDGRVDEGEAPEKLRQVLDHLCQEPDFIVEGFEGRKLPESVVPPTWATKYRDLARMWDFVVRRVLVEAGIYVAYRPGFTFDDTVEAKCMVTDDGAHGFLLAPFRKGKAAFGSVAANLMLAHELVDLAIHEAAHVAHGWHDEDFVLEMHRIRKCCRHVQFRRVLIEAKKAAANLPVVALAG